MEQESRMAIEKMERELELKRKQRQLELNMEMKEEAEGWCPGSTVSPIPDVFIYRRGQKERYKKLV